MNPDPQQHFQWRKKLWLLGSMLLVGLVAIIVFYRRSRGG